MKITRSWAGVCFLCKSKARSFAVPLYIINGDKQSVRICTRCLLRLERAHVPNRVVNYLCDRTHCAGKYNSYAPCNPECKHVHNVEFALNFRQLSDGTWWEKENQITAERPEYLTT